jgi:hypothetical protein
MSVLWVKPGVVKFALGPRGERTYSTTFTLRSNVPTESVRNILFSGLLPIYGFSPYPQDLLAICRKIEPVQNRDAPYHWSVDCEWSTLQEGNPQDQQKPPDQRRPVWGYTFQPLQKFWPCDLNGLKYCDSAGTPFDPPPSRPIYVQVYTIERFEQVGNRDSDANYLNHCNQNGWQGAQSGEALIQNIAVREVYEQAQYWHHCTYTVLKSPRITVPGTIAGSAVSPFVGAFDFECILDAGPKMLDVNNNPVPIVQDGFVEGRAVRLDGTGHVLTPAIAQNVYLKFANALPVDFGPLDLVPPY